MKVKLPETKQVKRCPVCDLSMRLYPHELCRELQDARNRLAEIAYCAANITGETLGDQYRVDKVIKLAKGTHAVK